LADRWGPRRLLSVGALLAGVGGFLFALAPDLWLAGAGRLLVGASVAVAFVGMIKLASHWMAPRQFAFVTGMALLIGVAGALLAGLPLSALIAVLGWRPVMVVVAVLTLLVAVGVWLIVRDDPGERGYRSYGGVLPKRHVPGVFSSLRRVGAYRNSWLLSIAPGGLCGAVLSFAGLWGVPFLVTHYQMSERAAAGYCSAMLLTFALGGPLLGALSERLGRRKPLYLGGVTSSLIGWIILVLFPGLSQPLLILVVLIAGFGCGGAMIIGFAHARESVPAPLAGTVSGLVNMGAVMGPMLLQPTIGWMLDLSWTGQMENGVPVYSFEAYRSGFLLILAWLALALVFLALTRETHCRPSAQIP
jgi:MFS family permease